MIFGEINQPFPPKQLTMKSILFILVGILLGLLLAWAYVTTLTPGIRSNSYAPFDFSESQIETIKNAKDHGEPIDPARVPSMVRSPGTNVKSIWFSIDTLKQYFDYWKVRSSATGIRVYMAKYDSLDPYANFGNPERMDLRGKNTIIFIPTGDSMGAGVKYRVDIDRAIYPVNRGYSCPPLPDSICKGQHY